MTPAGAPPAHVAPVLATLGALSRDPEGHTFAFKWDGIRAVAHWDGAALRLETRNRQDRSRGAELDAEAGTMREELAGTVTKLQQKNAEMTRLRAELDNPACRVALLDNPACRVALVSEENEQLRHAAGTGPVIGLPSSGKAGP